MKKSTSIKLATFAITTLLAASAFAEISLSGFVRGGVAASFSDKNGDKFTVTKLYPGIYFSGDSSATRFRLNFDAKTKTESGNTAQAFARFEISQNKSGEQWPFYLRYANAKVGIAGDLVTIGAGRIQDNFAPSVGFKGYSFFDELDGAFIGVTPVEGLSIAAAGVVDDATKGSVDIWDAWYVGAAKYEMEKFAVQMQITSKEILLLSVGYFSDSFTVAAEQFVALSDDGRLKLADAIVDAGKFPAAKNSTAKVFGNVWIEYRGLERWTFGLAAFESYSGSDDEFGLLVAPAVSFNATDLFTISLEAEYGQTFSDADESPYAAFIPSISFAAFSNAKASLWGVISTDSDQRASMAGVGAIVKF